MSDVDTRYRLIRSNAYAGDTYAMKVSDLHKQGRQRRWIGLAVFALVAVAMGTSTINNWAGPGTSALQTQPPIACIDRNTRHPMDCSGRPRVGIASFYARRFGGRTMADGTPMRLSADNAASRSLPLGTTALVRNLQTGQSAHITIRDRGPYVQGRLVDLSPATARKIGIEPRQGLALVEVSPIAVPLSDGTVRAGAVVTRGHRTIDAG